MELIRNFPDSELVARLRAGERMDDVIKAIYRTHFESLAWYVQNNSGSRQDAEDVFQEVVMTFIGLVQADKFRGESTVKTFLYSLNRHIWLNDLKKRGRALAREEKYSKGNEWIELDAAEFIAERESKSLVMDLMDKLGETCKQILLLFYYENQSMKEILETLHYENEQVVRNKKYKCLKQLGQLLNANPTLKKTLKNWLHG